jgi:hypothetical protein
MTLACLIGTVFAAFARQNPPERPSQPSHPNTEEVITAGHPPRCSPKIREFLRYAVGEGTGQNAVKAALNQYHQSYTAQQDATWNDASQWTRTAQCDPPCTRDGSMVLGPLASTEDWDINLHSNPIVAKTWSQVGYEGVVFCK